MDENDRLLSGTDDGYISEGSTYAGDISEIIYEYREEREDLPDSSSLSDSDSQLSGKRKSSLSSYDSSGATPPKKVKLSDEPIYSESVEIIAHCPDTEILMDRMQISRGVRFELARLISLGQLDYSDLTEERLAAVQGLNRDAAPKIAQVFLGAELASNTICDPAFAQEVAAHSPWQELDKEEEALSQGPYEGLGNNNSKAYSGWYGGKIEFRGRLHMVGEGKKKHPKIVLERCTLGPSSRFTRRFGSWSFLRVKIPQTAFHDPSNRLNQFFQKEFVIWGHVFRACYAKGDNVSLYWTNEMFPSFETIDNRLSFEEFINWHNPLAENTKQLMTKWSSRMVLGFSNSVPGPLLKQDCILPEIDIVSEKNSDMTDGCGQSTRDIHCSILNLLSLTSLPTAFQYRLGGYKGMSLLKEGQDHEDGAKIWVRPSQTKIKYPAEMPLDPAMLTIDLIRTPHLRTPSKISTDIIINLAENGVSHNEFVQLLKTSIRALVNGLIAWEGPNAMRNLWTNVERAGGVLMSRRAREAVGEARVRGYTNRSPEDAELDEEDADEDGFSSGGSALPRSMAWWADQISGCPSALEETVMVLLDSGFCPQKSPILREKLKQVVVKKIENRMQNLRFEIEQSCTAFAVPDPFGILGPEEIQIKSSSRNLKGNDGLLTDIILGDVLITRNPCKGPCDVRKVKAVEHPLLRNYVDVIVFSTQGHRRLIDFLGGGDYDGDVVTMIWALAFILNFQNAHEKHSEEPRGLDCCFTREQERVSDFIQKTQLWEPAMRVRAMQKYLLGSLSDTSLVGKYSAMHDHAIYELGYANPRTVQLNYKFCRVLDAPKTGYKINGITLSSDSKMYRNTLGPQWKAASKEKKKSKHNSSNMMYTTRDSDKLGRFIMDTLRRAADKEKDYLLAEMEKVFSPLCNAPDPDLIEPWDTAQKWAERDSGVPGLAKLKRLDLSIIAIHVREVFHHHKQSLVVKTKGNTNGNFTDLPIELRQDRLRSVSNKFHSGPDISKLSTIADEATLSRYRASYAYKYDAEQSHKDGVSGWSRFPWNVAMRDLCAIKAAASGPYKVITTEFYDHFKLVKRS